MRWTRSKVREWEPPEQGIAGSIALNLGCGLDLKDGWVNVDPFVPEADEHWNLLDIPWPVDTDSVSHILVDQVLEHLPPRVELEGGGTHDANLAVLTEASRVLKPKSRGRMLVGVPYANSPEDLQNLTHYRRYNQHTFDCLDNPRDSALEGLSIPLTVVDTQVVSYWTHLLGFINTAYIGDNYPIPVPSIGPPQQVFCVLRSEAGEAPELSTVPP